MKFFEDKYNILTNYEKDVIEFINKKPMDFVNFSINKIADVCAVSSGVISRLYIKIGFNSLRDMQFYVHYKVITNNFINEEVESKTPKNFAQKITNTYIYAINKIVENLNNQIFVDAIQRIIEASVIRLYGNKQSLISCQLLNLKLESIGKTAIVEQDFSNLLAKIDHLSQQELFILFSHSGKSKEIDFLIDVLKNKNIDFILITANPELIKTNKWVLIYEINDIWVNNSINNSISQHYIIDVIVEYLKVKLNFKECKTTINEWNTKEKK
ncbi:MurR/RpiR family transcriptional regulator [Candidatus Mycoplasma pogonae]